MLYSYVLLFAVSVLRDGLECGRCLEICIDCCYLLTCRCNWQYVMFRVSV